MSEPLRIESLYKTYHHKDGATVAAEDITLRIEPGSVLGFLGPNGAGKTTVIKCAARLVLPDRGQIWVNGVELNGRGGRDALRHLGAVLEGARNVYWHLSPRENLCYFGRQRGVTERVIRTRSEELLRSLELADLADRPVKELSRGNQQKVAIAVALIHDPYLLLLDEPTLGLDVAATAKMVEIVHALAREQGKAVLLTTHQMEIAAELSDRIAVIRKGQLLLSEERTHLLTRFEAKRATTTVIAGTVPLAMQVELQERFPGLEVHTGVAETKFSFLPTKMVPAEELFVRLWQCGYQIRSFSRQASLEEVYLELVSGSLADGGAISNHEVAATR